jgi:hypothetical protein
MLAGERTDSVSDEWAAARGPMCLTGTWLAMGVLVYFLSPWSTRWS